MTTHLYDSSGRCRACRQPAELADPHCNGAPSLAPSGAVGEIAKSLQGFYNVILEVAAKTCEQQVQRPAGYQGNWEGYGDHMGDRTGAECAAAIRAMKYTEVAPDERQEPNAG